jgi:hypothetical protein
MDKDFDFKNWKLPLPVIGQLYPGELVVFPSSKRKTKAFIFWEVTGKR